MSEFLSILISREMFVSLALIGGACSVMPMMFAKSIGPNWSMRFGKASYVFMFLSMASFIFSGLLA
jgi:hypothetical protein